MKFLLDTNVVIYLLGGQLAMPLPVGEYGLSIISEIELLSFSSLSAAEEEAIRVFIASLDRLPLTDEVRDGTIALRKANGLKLPDAMIAATALNWGATLLTNDSRLTRVPGLPTKVLDLKQT